MPKPLTEGTIKRLEELTRLVMQLSVDVARLWKRIEQLEDVIRNSGINLPPGP